MSTPPAQSWPAQQPMQPMQQPMQQPMMAYGPPVAGPSMDAALTKTVLFIFLLVAALLIVIGHLLSSLLSEPDPRKVGIVLSQIGGLMAFTIAVAGALGSKRTSDWQNLGLLVLAAALAMSQL